MPDKTNVIEVVPYNPEWKKEFKKIKAMINCYIGDLILAIEHVGSTSIEGLAARRSRQLTKLFQEANS